MDGAALRDPAKSALQVGWLQREFNLPNVRIRIVEYAEQRYDVCGAIDRFRLELALSSTRNTVGGRVRFPEEHGEREFRSAGDLFLLQPSRFMHSWGHTGPRQAIVLDIAPAAFTDWFGHDGTLAPDGGQATLDIDSQTIRTTLRRLSNELIDPGLAADAMCELLARQVALDLLRHCHRRDASWQSGGLSPHRLRLIEERVREPGPPPGLEELAGLCSLSVRQLTRGFRASRHCSIGEFLAEKRMENACQLLGTGRSIKEIAGLLGFASTGNFSTAFRKACGRSPREYRVAVALGAGLRAGRG